MMADGVLEDIHIDAGAEGYRDDIDIESTSRRRSSTMSAEEERRRRASIKSILADTSILVAERWLRVQLLMDEPRDSSSDSESLSPCDSTSNRPDCEHSSASNVRTLPNTSDMFPSETNRPSTCVSNEHTKHAILTCSPCTHYDRKCAIVSPCCGATFGCRFCHNTCPVLPPKLKRQRHDWNESLPTCRSSARPQDAHHNIDRFAIEEIICRECNTRQSSKTNSCISCKVQFGAYHCNICNLWMSDDESPFHCSDCGFCRLGGAENYRHCHNCGVCIDLRLFNSHNCKEGKFKSDCPVCLEYLFTSRSASHEMPCGHAIHWDCFRQFAEHDLRCPLCKKTAVDKKQMMEHWNVIAADVAMHPLPPELARVVNIACNDCELQDDARAWHVHGVQCRNCSSFNTVVNRIVMFGLIAHEFLESQHKPTNDSNHMLPSRRRVSKCQSHLM